MPLVLVRTVSGSEGLAAEEIAARGHRVVDVSKRQLIVEATDELVRRPPRLADDVFLVQDAVPDPGRTKDSLRSVSLTAKAVGPFAVSASFVGERNFNRYDVEDHVGAVLGGEYHSRRGGARPPAQRSEWRVVLDGKTMWVGVRPYDVPLHRRAWRQRTVVGSLHPPVAAAMARLARIEPGMRVLDPFCGAGTLLVEAHELQPTASYRGIDRRAEAVAATRANSTAVQVQLGDAARVSGPVDRIITNPPWGVRLAVGDLTPYLRAWRQVLAPDGLVVALLSQEQAALLGTGWTVQAAYDISVAGQHPRIVVLTPQRI
ncbi:TRM11 family SAM-dependent methyltransferase [Kribbella sp. NPDC058245]|uniref:TRM11 family SAM-dependent methyltransferase n=1 Tax=Kribbella sp. NPDC058245 TaxID=3346399 RepID=UPI0036EFEC9D